MANGYLRVRYQRYVKYPNGNSVNSFIANGEKRDRAWNNDELIYDVTTSYNNTEITDGFLYGGLAINTPGMMRIKTTGDVIVTVGEYKDTSYVWSMDYTCYGPAIVIEEDIEDVFIELGALPLPNLFWPEERPDDYDSDRKWVWDGTQYAWAVGGGGRYRNQLIAVGFDSNGIGTIYFGDI